MMIPIRDELPTRRFPVVTVVLIGLNILVFLYTLRLGAAREILYYRAGLIPAVLWSRAEISLSPLNPGLTLLTSMFLHGNLFHIGFNLLYLWIFGNNVEDYLGRFQFILFYLGSGLAAGLLHAVIYPDSLIPTIGASGAVAGAMGGYFILFPRARVLVMFFWGFFVTFARVSAAFVLGFWILLQTIYGVYALFLPQAGGVAWFAHIGGFAVGLIWCKLVALSRPQAYY